MMTRTPSFHIAVSSSMPSSCPQPMAVVAVIPNRLSLVSLWLREAQRWWSWKLTRQLFLWFRSLFENEGLPEPVGRIAKTSWPRRTRFKQIFCSSRKDSTYRKCSIALFIVASESEWSDNQMFVSLPPYPIPHQCHQCSSVNRITLRMFIRVLSLSPPPPRPRPPPFSQCTINYLSHSPTVWTPGTG